MRSGDGQFQVGAPIVLIPARLLPLKPVWMGIVDELGQNDILLILPTSRDFVRRAFEHVGRSFHTAGYCVTTMSAERLLSYCQTVLNDADDDHNDVLLSE
jgi:hypothetical protein